ncbi:MAG TPA: hypothetical protein VMZ50_13495, partial [Phycisphaerae bacterium]|nr:hypothetical protein [Phycisphaerae bacterium]
MTTLLANPDGTLATDAAGNLMVAPTQEEFEACCCAAWECADCCLCAAEDFYLDLAFNGDMAELDGRYYATAKE